MAADQEATPWWKQPKNWLLIVVGIFIAATEWQRNEAQLRAREERASLMTVALENGRKLDWLLMAGPQPPPSTLSALRNQAQTPAGPSQGPFHRAVP